MRPKAEWAIDSEAMMARGIIVLVKSNYHKVKYDRPGECSPEKDCLR